MIAENISRVKERIAEAVRRAGRKEGDVRLVAVSKAHGPEAIAEAVRAGQFLFGENRVQEARSKIPLCPSSAQWHFIGHLQKNKAKQAATTFEVIQSVDSLELGLALNTALAELALRKRVLLEVNVAGESSKFGFAPEHLRSQLEQLAALDRLEIEGLMCIPPFVPKPDMARPYFERLRVLREELEAEAGFGLPELSMGMSHDFEQAILEGATLVRVGTAIFGERTAKAWKPPESTSE
jgi:pyridoxal phosphate enzyme (YggS family)